MKTSIGTLRTPSTYTRILLQRFPQLASALLADTGLTLESVLRAPTMTVAQQLQVIRNVKATAVRDDWALDFGRQISISGQGSLGFAALSAPTLGEGFEVLARYARIRAPNFNFRTRHSGDRLLLEVSTELWPQEDLVPWSIEVVLQVIAAYVEAVLGHRSSECLIMLASPPPSHAAAYADYFSARCEFNAPANAFALPAAFAVLPCPLHDEKTYRASLIRCREALDALLSPGDVVIRVQNLLSSHFDRLGSDARDGASALPRLEDIASTLCVSPRTLIRQLAAHGTSYRKLLEQEQREVARKLLDQARHSVSEIAVMLGYSDVTNFDRAFRRMFGVSPVQYRRRAD